MTAVLAVAGFISIALALGHATLGLVWVLPHVAQDHLPATPFGPRSMTHSMIRVTWHLITVFASTTGVILLVLAWVPDVEPITVALRGFAVMWLAATAVALSVTRVRLRSLLRLPVPVLWLVLAVLCWHGST